MPYDAWINYFKQVVSGGRPGRPGGADQVATRNKLAQEESFINTETTQLGTRIEKGKLKDNMVDMYKQNDRGGIDYVEVDAMLEKRVPVKDLRVKLKNELGYLKENDRLIYVDKTNSNNRIIYEYGENPSVVDSKKY